MASSRVARWCTTVLLICAFVCAAGLPLDAQSTPAVQEVLIAEMVVQSVRTLPFTQQDIEKLRIDRWSTMEDILWIKKCLSSGDQNALKKLFIKKERIGRLEQMSICYAAYTRDANGGLEILCVTPERMGQESKHERELVFSAIQLHVDSSGQGTGSIYSFARFAVTEANFCKIQTCRDPSFRLLGVKVISFTP